MLYDVIRGKVFFLSGESVACWYAASSAKKLFFSLLQTTRKKITGLQLCLNISVLTSVRRQTAYLLSHLRFLFASFCV